MNNEKLVDRLTMMISTCNKFSDLWDAHIYLINKNWSNRGIKTLLVTDDKTERVFKGIRIISAGAGTEFSERTKVALDLVNTKYVLITLDDYFPIYPICSDKINLLIDIMEKEELDYIRLFNRPNSNKRMPGYKDLYNIDLDRAYRINLYPGIWRKTFLEKTIMQPLSAWEYEVSLTKIANDCGARCVLSKGQEFEILDVVRKGKLLNKANRYLKKHNIYDGNRAVISYREELKLFMFSQGKKFLPKPLKILAKQVLSNKGQKFYSDNHCRKK